MKKGKFLLLMISIISFVIINNIITNKAIDKCINSGRDVKICEELRK